MPSVIDWFMAGLFTIRLKNRTMRNAAEPKQSDTVSVQPYEPIYTGNFDSQIDSHSAQ